MARTTTARPSAHASWAPFALLALVFGSCAPSAGDGALAPDGVTSEEDGRQIITREVMVRTPKGMEAREVQYCADELLVLVHPGALATGRDKRSAATAAHVTSPDLRAELQGVLGAQHIRRLGVDENVAGRPSLFLLEGIQVDPYDYSQRPGGGILVAEPNYVLQLDQSTGQITGPPTGPVITPAVTPSDPLFSSQWALSNVGQTNGRTDADIDGPEAWTRTMGDHSVVVAIVDTGVDYTHPDLLRRMWTNPGELQGNGIDDDGNGYIDDFYGYNFRADQPDPIDDHGHGTHTAGTVAADWNNVGVVGVAPRCRIMALKVFGSGGSGTSSAAAEAILYAADMGARVTNNSWGSPIPSEALRLAFQYAHDRNVTSIASAGNDGGELPRYPASLDSVLSVAALDDQDQPATFTNYGLYVDLAAPGVSVLSTVPYSRDPSGYAFFSGTSMASPHVAGVAALILSRNQSASPGGVFAALRTAVDPLDVDRDLGTGRINARKAVDREHFPDLLAHLRLESTDVSGSFAVHGTAAGPDFASYLVEVGFGITPRAWTTIAEGDQPVVDGLLATVDLSQWPTGTSRIRIRVRDEGGTGVIDADAVQVDNFFLSSPGSHDVARAGDVLDLSGSVGVHAFTNFQVEWQAYEISSSGFEVPLSAWSTNGINLVGSGSQQVIGGHLGTFDTSAVTEGDRVRLRLRGYGSEMLEEIADLYLDPDLKAGWPVRIDHDPAYMGRLGVLEPLVEDLDADGAWELYALTTGRLHGFTSDGTALPGFPVQLPIGAGEEYSTSALTAGDVDGDGRREIVVGGVRGSTILIHAIEKSGAPASGFPLAFPYNEAQSGPAVITPYSSVVVADLDADGANELVYQAFDVLVVAETTGVLLTGQLVHLRPSATFACQPPSLPTTVDPTPAVADIDGDAQLEIVVFHQTADCGQAGAGGMGKVSVFDPNGSTLPGWPRITTYPPMGASPALGDIDGQGGLEIVVAAGTTYDRGGVHAFDAAGNPMPGWPQLESQNAFTCAPTLADLDGDGDLEIVLGGTKGSWIYLYHHTGAPFGNALVHGFSTPYAVAVTDINQDGLPDLAATKNEFPNSLYPQLTRGAMAWDFTGQWIPGFPRVTESNAWAPIQVVDFDGDGFVEGVASSFKDVGDGYFTFSDAKRRGSIYVWNLPWVEHPQRDHLWPSFHGNHQRTGLYQN